MIFYALSVPFVMPLLLSLSLDPSGDFATPSFISLGSLLQLTYFYQIIECMERGILN
jgi:hypothetical protein